MDIDSYMELHCCANGDLERQRYPHDSSKKIKNSFLNTKMRPRTRIEKGQTLKGETLYIRHMKIWLEPQEMYLNWGLTVRSSVLVYPKLPEIKLGMERIKYSRI